MRVARRSKRQTSLLDNAARLKDTSACCASRLARDNRARQTHRETSSNYLCTNGGLETGGLPSGGCGDLIAEREFLSDKVYRRDYRGVLGVESLSAEGLAFVVIHTSVGSGVNLIAPFPES